MTVERQLFLEAESGSDKCHFGPNAVVGHGPEATESPPGLGTQGTADIEKKNFPSRRGL